MSLVFAELLLLLVLPLTVFYIWALVDVLRTPGPVWDAAGENQLLWAGVVVLLSLLGAVLYYTIARPRLRAAQAMVASSALVGR